MKITKTKKRALILFLVAVATYILVYYVYADFIDSPDLPQIVKLLYEATPFLGVFISITVIFNEYAAKRFEENKHDSHNQNQNNGSELVRADRNE